MADGKPSFFSSVASGITGSLKGAAVGSLVGAVLGAAIGATIAIFTAGFGLAAIASGAALGASIVGVTMGAIGSASGMVTGIVTHHEAAKSPAEMENIVKVAYAKGVSVGRQIEQEQLQAHRQAHEHEDTKWRDRHAQEQAAQAISKTIH